MTPLLVAVNETLPPTVTEDWLEVTITFNNVELSDEREDELDGETSVQPLIRDANSVTSPNVYAALAILIICLS